MTWKEVEEYMSSVSTEKLLASAKELRDISAALVARCVDHIDDPVALRIAQRIERSAHRIVKDAMELNLIRQAKIPLPK